MRVKLFFLLDMLATSIFAVYAFFLRSEEVAIMTGLSIFIAFSPICLWLSRVLVLHFAKKVLKSDDIKVNNSDAIITMTKINTVATPMNRFLTNGEYFVTDLFPEGLSQNALLSTAASVEQNAHHAFARIIYNTAIGRDLPVQEAVAFNEIPSRGAEALINNTPVRIGNPQWIKDQDVSISAQLLTKLDQLAVHGKTPLLLSMGSTARGIVALKDEINPETQSFVSILKRNNLSTILLTASNKRTAKNIAKDFEFDEVKTDLTPKDKSRELQMLRAKGKKIAVIANEFHDLPMLFAADVSILLKDGSMPPVADDSDAKMDFEILKLDKFLTLRERQALTQHKLSHIVRNNAGARAAVNVNGYGRAAARISPVFIAVGRDIFGAGNLGKFFAHEQIKTKCAVKKPLISEKLSILIGMTGFEPATSSSRTMRATKLCYIP